MDTASSSPTVSPEDFLSTQSPLTAIPVVSPEDFLKQGSSSGPAVSPEDFLRQSAPALPLQPPAMPKPLPPAELRSPGQVAPSSNVSPYQIQAEEPPAEVRPHPKLGPAMVFVPSHEQQQYILHQNPHEDINALTAPLVDTEALDKELSQWLVGPFAIHRGLIKALTSMTSPVNIAIAGGTAGLGVAAGAATGAAGIGLKSTVAALDGYFATQAGKQFVQAVPEAYQEYKKGNYEEALSKGGGALADGLMAYAAASHAIGTARATAVAGSEALAQHNIGAEESFKQEASRTTPVAEGEGTPVVGVNKPMNVRASKLSPTGDVAAYEVIDPNTGKVLNEGTAQQTQNFITKNSAKKITPGAEPEIPKDEPAPPPTSDLDKGTTFDIPRGKLTIIENDGRLISYQLDAPSGPQRGTAPVAFIRKMVGSVAPTLPESTSSATPSPAASAPEQQPNGSVAHTAPETAAATPSTPAAPEAQDTNVETSPSGEKLFGSGSRPKVPFSDIVDFLRTKGKGSVSQLQREFQFGYGTAQAALDHATDLGILGPEDGSKPRELLKTEETKPVTNPPEQTEQAAVTPEADAIQPNSEPAIPEQVGAGSIANILGSATRKYKVGGEAMEESDPRAQMFLRSLTPEGRQQIDAMLPASQNPKIIGAGFDHVIIDRGDGTVMRLGPAPNHEVYSPYVLQPISSRQVGNVGVEIYPKVNTEGITDKDVKTVEDDLAKQGLKWGDAAKDNLGRDAQGNLKIFDGQIEKSHAYSSTQFNMPAPIASAIKKFGESIPKDLLVDKGIETEPHATILYGLADNVSANVEKVLQGENAVPVKLGRTSVFKTPEADVLKLDVESPELHALNAKVATLDHKSDYPQFVPHVTIAYLKSGTSDPYVDKVVVGATGMKPTLDTVKFSPADGEAKNIPLQKSAAKTSAQQIAENEKRISELQAQMGKKPVTPQVTEPGTKYVVPSFVTGAPVPSSRAFDKSIKQLPVTVKIKDGTITAVTRAAGKGGEVMYTVSFPDYEWPSKANADAFGNIHYQQDQFIKQKMKDAGVSFDENIDVPGQEQLVNPDRLADSHRNAINEAIAKLEAPTKPVAQPQEKTTLEAGEPANAKPSAENVESVRPADHGPLEKQLPEPSQSTGEVGTTERGSGESGPVGEPSERTGAEQGTELEPSGGTISGVVGDAAEPERTFPPRAKDVVSIRHDRDYRIPDGRIVSGSPEARARINIEAIKALREIQSQNRTATVQEQHILAGYVGWGAVPQLFSGVAPEFRTLQAELKGLLSDEEYSDAQRSTTNAHYTGDVVVDAMWKAMQKIGAKPGMSWLEPAIGVGNFFGRQPVELLEGARRVGLDKDSVSGQIAKLLYPDSGVDIKAFEEAELPNDYFDGAISNVPFGNFGVHDPEFRGKNYLTGSIHNYFFAKALNLVRPGGVVGFVTSRYTMDAYAPAAVNFRKWIAERAHLVGAVRLPSGAFRQNAGTDVITDIIFLRKKLPGEASIGEAWENTKNKHLRGTYGQMIPTPTNEYFHDHPEMVLGDESLSRGQFSDHDYDVKGNVTPEKIAEAVDKFPGVGFEDYAPSRGSRKIALREINAPAEQSKLGGLFFDKDGNLFRKTSKGSAEPVDIKDSAKMRIKSQLVIRDALAKLLDAELNDKPEPELKALRKTMNNVYDNFVNKNGPLSSQSNTAAMKGDPDAPLLVSLERKFDKGNKAKGTQPFAEKAPIFDRRMLRPTQVPTSVGDPKEALYISLNEKGRIDWDRMAELTGRTPEQLQQDLGGLVFNDPVSNTWQTAEEYLSGSVRNKLKQAQAIAKIEPQYQGNVEALEKVQPEDIPPGEIRALLGVTWVPLDSYGQFATELLGTNKPVSVKYVGGNWMVDPGWGNHMNNAPKWGTARVPAIDLLSDALNMKRTKVIDRFADGTSSVNPQETQSARAKQMEMQDHFEKWLFADSKRGDQLVRLYNDTQNDLRLRTYDGAHLTLPGMVRDAAVLRSGDLDPHQKAAVWRQIVQPNVLLAHSVGSGKSFESIAGAMELKRLGLIRRPMFVVPNATLTSWQQQFGALYPQARTLVFSEKDLAKENRKRVMAEIATGDWDATVVPQSSFQFLPTGDDIFEQHFKKLSDELEQQIVEAQDAGIDTRMIKRMEKSKERLLTGLRDKRKADTKDRTVTWEQLGIDHLVIDESQDFKKLGFSTKQGNVAGIDQNGNQKTFDLLMKLRYTQQHGRGAVFMSGTPVTNTMGELYSIMKYLIEPELEARGIGKFDEWAANFGRTVDVFEPKIEGGGYQMKARFAQFVNIPELAQLFRSFADVVTSDMLDIPRPEIVGGKRQAVETQLTEEQEDYLEELRERAKNIRQDPRGALPDNMLAVYTDAGKMAMDIRMVRPGAPDDPDGRLNKAADNIHKLWQESTPVKGTQLVMSDIGKPAEAGGSKDFSAYDDLIKKLVERGIPRNEIAHIYQAKNKAQRAKIFQDVNDGRIRVLLGSTQKMGVGVNVQQRLYAMHHLDVPHRPSDLEQREGRILRQGNENPSVHLYYYVTKGSLDEAKFANVVRKAKFINQVMQGKSSVREAEDVGGMVPSLEMFQAMASGDPRVMQKMETDAEVDRLSNVYSGWKNQQYKIRSELSQIPQRIEWAEKSIQNIKRDIAARDAAGNVWTVGKKQFSGEKISKDVHEALAKEVNKVADRKAEDVEIGTAHGLPLLASYISAAKWIKVEIGDTTSITIGGDEMAAGTLDLYRRIENKILGLEGDVAFKEGVIDKAKAEENNLKSSLEDQWPYAKKFTDLVETQQRLVKELGADKGDDAAMAMDEGGEIADKSVEAQEPDAEQEEDGEDEEETPPGLTESKKGERGSIPLNTLTLGMAEHIEKNVAPALVNLGKHIGAFKKDVVKLLAPSSLDLAESTKLTLRQRAADLARSTDIAGAALDAAHLYFETKSIDHNLDFMDNIETGKPQAAPELQPISDSIGKILADRKKQVQDLGTGKLEDYVENYFPHIWEKPKDASRLFKEWYSKSPMQGSKSFLKKRVIPTIKEGIELGLVPASTNPIDLVLSKVREMDKYIFAHRSLNDLKHDGTLKFVKATDVLPDGYAYIDDKVATVYGPVNEQGAITTRGRYAAPEEAATLINNYLSPGLRKYASFRAYVGIGNSLNQFQLGWSAYHLGFTTFDAAVSRFALGVMQFGNANSVKDVMRGLGSMATFPIAPFTGLLQGDRMLKEWNKPGSQGADIGLLVDAAVMAGGRAKMDSFYRTSIVKSMIKTIKTASVAARIFSGSVGAGVGSLAGHLYGFSPSLGASVGASLGVAGALKLPFAMTELVSKPVMEWAVPRQKMAVFADLAREILSKHENNPEDAQAELAEAWDSVDNRMGQLVYDNLFWNKALKDILMATTRSVGWNVGTIREILGGGVDTLGAAGKVVTGTRPRVTPRMGYIIGLPIIAGLLGAITYYLATGEYPEELKDYYFPRRGARGTSGWHKRFSFPSYVKDAAHWYHDPYGTIKGKVHPFLTYIMDMISNEDYLHRQIRNENDPLVQKMMEGVKYSGETIEPIAARALTSPDKKGQETTAEKILPFIGITEAPSYIKQSEEPGPRHFKKKQHFAPAR